MTIGGRELLCAVVDAADRDPLDVAADARRALRPERGAVRAAASRPAPPERLRHSFHEARCALEATAFDNGTAPGGRLLARPRRLHPAALDPGRRGAEALLRQRPRADRGGRRGVRRRAAALAGGVHRAERPVGAGGPPGLLPPPHAALPDAQGRGADRPRPLAAPTTGSSSGWPCARGSWSREGRRPDGDQGRRVPGRDHPGRGARNGRARPRGADPGRRRRGQRDRRRRVTRRRARGSSPTPPRSSARPR